MELAKIAFWQPKFEKDWCVSVYNPEDEFAFRSGVHVPGVIATLTDDQDDCVIATCSDCYEPECIGIYEQRLRKTEDRFVYELNCRGSWRTLTFDRAAYEQSALTMLREMTSSGLNWWNEYFGFYKNLDAFQGAVARAEAKTLNRG